MVTTIEYKETVEEYHNKETIETFRDYSIPQPGSTECNCSIKEQNCGEKWDTSIFDYGRKNYSINFLETKHTCI